MRRELMPCPIATRIFGALPGALLAFAAAEGAVRYFYDVHYVYDAQLGYLRAPGVTRSTGESPPAVSTWTTDGLRRKTPPDATRPRVLVLGDSFTDAAMIDDGNVYTDRLQTELPQYEFLNAGRVSMSSADYVAFAPVYKERFRPRWTVIQMSPNDLAEDAFDKPDLCHFSVSSDGELVLHPVVPPHKRGLTYWLRERSMFAFFLWVRYGMYRLGLSQEKPLFRAARPPPVTRAAPDYPVEAVMDRLAAAYEERVTFAFIVSYVPEAPTEETPEERRIFARCKARGYSCVSTRAGYARFSEEGRAPFGFETSQFNVGHMNEAGHALLARVVAEELQRLHALL